MTSNLTCFFNAIFTNCYPAHTGARCLQSQATKKERKILFFLAASTPRFLLFLDAILNLFLMFSHNPSFCLNKTKVFEATSPVLLTSKRSSKWKNGLGRCILELSCESGVHSSRGTQWFFHTFCHLIFPSSNQCFSRSSVLPQ